MNTIRKNPLSLILIFILPFISVVLLKLVEHLDLNGLSLTALVTLAINFFLSLGFNYPQLIEAKQRKKLWLGILIALTSISIFFIIACLHVRSFDGYYSEVPDVPLFIFATLAMQTGMLLFSAHLYREQTTDPDAALLLTINRYLHHSVIYAFFAVITMCILSLGFWLLSLTGIDIPKILFGSNIGIYRFFACFTFCASTLLLFLLLIPVKARSEPLPYLFVFQYITLIFVFIYLLITMFTGTTVIGSDIRMLIAAILWGLSIISHDAKKPRLILNLITSIVGLILLLLSIRGILIRIEDTHFSENRGYALASAVLLCIAHLSSLVKIILHVRRAFFTERVRTVSMFVLCFCFILMMILPLKQWAFNQQKEYYLSSEANIENFDDYAFIGDFGEAGESVAQTVNGTETVNGDEEKINMMDKIHIFPENLAIDDKLQTAIAYYYHDNWRLKSHDSLIAKINPDHDKNTEEYLLFLINDRKDYVYEVISLTLNEARCCYDELTLKNVRFTQEENEALINALQNGKIRYSKPIYRYDDIHIGNLKIPVVDLEVAKMRQMEIR